MVAGWGFNDISFQEHTRESDITHPATDDPSQSQSLLATSMIFLNLLLLKEIPPAEKKRKKKKSDLQSMAPPWPHIAQTHCQSVNPLWELAAITLSREELITKTSYLTWRVVKSTKISAQCFPPSSTPVRRSVWQQMSAIFVLNPICYVWCHQAAAFPQLIKTALSHHLPPLLNHHPL